MKKGRCEKGGFVVREGKGGDEQGEGGRLCVVVVEMVQQRHF